MFGSSYQLSDYLQAEEAECGLMCLAAATAVLGGALSAADMRRNHNVSVRGASAGQLCDIAVGLNLLASPVACEAAEVGQLQLPAIAHWNERHFVLLLAVRGGRVRIFDPALGERTLAAEEFACRFSGRAIQLQRAHAFRRSGPRTRLRLDLIQAAMRGTRSRVAQLLALSLLLQLAALGVPLLSQLTINMGAMEGDVHAVAAISGCVLLVYLANFFVESWRALINQKISTHLSDYTARNLFRHLMALPMPWFERRRIADITTRFDSIEPMRSALGSGLATLVIDGSLGLLLALALVLVSPKLAFVVIVSVLLTVVCKLAFSPYINRTSAEAALHRIQEGAKRWEAFRNMQSLKLAGAEFNQERVWDASFRQYVVANAGAQTATALQQSTSNLLSAVSSLAMIYMGAVMIAAGELSVGALFAFVIYRRYLADKIAAAIDQVSALWLLKFHMSRVSEVFDTEPEPRWNDVREFGDYTRAGALEIRNLHFRHSANEPMLLEALNLKIEPGELVMIVAPSGRGKSTLLRLLAGLYTPTAGEILLDGTPISAFGPRVLRRSLGAVMQEDELLGGTVFDNITMFDDQPDLQRAIDALTAAEAWDMVRALPLGIHTPVGDGGRLMSAGQRQRVLIARALYRRPRILLLDEATSNVDPDAEARIFDRLRQLRSTKIVVTHHGALRQYADRLILMDSRGLREQGRVIAPAEEAMA
ncbi:peptidase domain-containing ABC transporter [Lysobacter tyrosinilyticus]